MATAYTNEIPKFQGRAHVKAVSLSEIWEPELGSSYKDILTQSHNFLRPEYPEGYADITDPILAEVVRELAAVKDCGNGILRGTCDNGHEWGKVTRCGREWCPNCGQLGSDAHRRRYSRIMDKLIRMRAAGMFVIQWPKVSRTKLRSAKVLRKVATAITRWMKRHGFDRGIRAWDWFGDPRCPFHHKPGDHNRETGRYECKVGKPHDFGLEDVRPEDMEFNPHLNVIVDVGGISPTGFLENLDELKADLRRLLKEPQLIVHYGFSNELAGILHMGRYAVKPTFHDVGWDFEMVAQLVGFRSFWAWGKWDDEPYWTLEETEDSDAIVAIAKLEKGFCPECDAAVTWHGIWNLKALRAKYAIDDAGGGYLRIHGQRQATIREAVE